MYAVLCECDDSPDAFKGMILNNCFDAEMCGQSDALADLNMLIVYAITVLLA